MVAAGDASDGVVFNWPSGCVMVIHFANRRTESSVSETGRDPCLSEIPMKLRVVSDLHFEFHTDNGATLADEVAEGDFDVLIVAGDLSNFDGLKWALATLCNAVAPRRMVYVIGNHEAYGGTLKGVLQRVRSVATFARGCLKQPPARRGSSRTMFSQVISW
jgi:hypothetical protein